MDFTQQEIEDVLSALGEAMDELCVDSTGQGSYPEATAYYGRLGQLIARFRGALRQ